MFAILESNTKVLHGSTWVYKTQILNGKNKNKKRMYEEMIHFQDDC